jgi:hypothetical protein
MAFIRTLLPLPIRLTFLLIIIGLVIYVKFIKSSEKTVLMGERTSNTLTSSEKEAGWELLWDGKTFKGWRTIYEKTFPKSGWIIQNNALVCLGTELPDSLRGGAIITYKKYSSFELKLEFKIKPKANSGIKYFIDESLKASPRHGLGLEYAILDDANWPYDRPDYNRTCGSLYDLVRAPENKNSKPIGEWNEARILVKENHIEHWLNGSKTVEIEKGGAKYRELVAKSKYRDIERWGEFPAGHILLQDEGPRAEFRNIKIREL